MSEKIKAWDFVVAHYPNYDSCDNIALSNDFAVIIDDEVTEDSHALKLLQEYNPNAMSINDLTEVQKMRLKYDALQLDNDIYERAMVALMEANQPKTVYYLMGSILTDNYFDGNWEYILNRFKTGNNDGCVASFTYTGGIDNAIKVGRDIAEATEGWIGFTEIGAYEYNEIQKAIKEYENSLA